MSVGQFWGRETIKPLTKYSTTQVSLEAGTQCLVGGLGVVTDSNLLASVSTTGLGGLDTGTVAASTLYYVYLVVNSSGVAGLVLSLSSSYPTGFICYKLIGSILTDATSTVAVVSKKNLSQTGTEEWHFTQLGNNMINLNDEIEFALSGSMTVIKNGASSDYVALGNTSNTIYSLDDSGNSRTKFIATKTCKAFLFFSTPVFNAGYTAVIYKNGAMYQRGSIVYTSQGNSTASTEMPLVSGDFITFGVPGNLVYTSTTVPTEVTILTIDYAVTCSDF